MIQLVIDNSQSRITGLTAPEMAELKQLLSYRIDSQAMHFSGNHGSPFRTLLSRRGEFPTGLLYLAKHFLENYAHRKYEVIDRRIRPKTPAKPLFTLRLPFAPYPEQEFAAMAAQAHHRGIITMPTGVGKSAVVALIVSKLQVRTLVVVPSLELKRQLTQFLKEVFSEDQVGPQKDIWIENVDALDPKAPLHGYDAVIIDEFHHAAAKTYRQVNKHGWAGIYYRFGLTATPFRSQENERLLLEAALAEVIYRLDYVDAVSRGYIVPIEAYFYELPKRDVEGYTWAQVYNELVVDNALRNTVIADMMLDLASAGKSTLCLVKEIEHGIGLSSRCGAGFANGQQEAAPELIRGFNSCQLTVLIATTGVCGEGVDTKPCEYVIIAGLGKSRNQFMQQCGRAVRKYPGKTSAKVILFKDPSHKWTLNHFREQVKFLREEYGVTPVKLNG